MTDEPVQRHTLDGGVAQAVQDKPQAPWGEIDSATPRDPEHFIILWCREDDSYWWASWQGGMWFGCDEYGLRRTSESFTPDYWCEFPRVIAAQPPAAPVETGDRTPTAWNCIYPTRGHITLRQDEAEAAAADGAEVIPLFAGEALRLPVPTTACSSAVSADPEILAETMCDMFEGQDGSFCEFGQVWKDRWLDFTHDFLQKFDVRLK